MKRLIIFAVAAMLLFTSCGISEPGKPAETSAVSQAETGFLFSVTEPDGKTTQTNIHTEKTTVGDALLELKIIDGTASESGFYVTTVNGVTADYDADKSYWAFYIDGEYAVKSIDKTEIESEKVYSLVYTKA